MEKMKLGDFISQTIIEIMDGVSKAQEYAQHNDAAVNPRHILWKEEQNSFVANIKHIGKDEAPLITPIDFDILLTIGQDDKAQGGIGIFAASLGIGLKGETKDYSESTNRVKFQIMIKLPQQKKG